MTENGSLGSFPGRAFATAWLNAWLSTSDDDARRVLYRTVLVERFEKHLQLVATDSYTLTGSACPMDPEDFEAPAFEELPESSFVVMDHDKRMVVLMRWLLADCKHAEKNKLAEPTVHLELRSGESPDTPTLDPAMDRQQLVVTTDRERLTLDVLDSEYPSWRPLLLNGSAEPVEKIALNPVYLARLGKIRTVGAEPVEFEFNGPLGLVLVVCRTEPVVFGGVMPVRIGAE